MKKQLTLADLLVQTKKFAASHSKLWFPETYAVTDGKAIGTFIADVEREKWKSFLLHFRAEESKKRVNTPRLAADPYEFASTLRVQGLPWGLIPIIEHKFREYLQKSYAFEYGNSALGIDFPELELECSY